MSAAAKETPVAALIDLVGGGYVELALELDIATDRIDTIVDFPSIEKYGVKGDGGAAECWISRLVVRARACWSASATLVRPSPGTHAGHQGQQARGIAPVATR